jgi:hypothetical protein
VREYVEKIFHRINQIDLIRDEQELESMTQKKKPGKLRQMTVLRKVNNPGKLKMYTLYTK